jgi:hypothetical protein
MKPVELPKSALDVATQRVGRFRPREAGGPTWTGVIMDTNPPDDDHWWYRAEKDPPGKWEFFKQPGGLIEVDSGEYKPNPKAENIGNLPGGHEYYLRQVPGKAEGVDQGLSPWQLRDDR